MIWIYFFHKFLPAISGVHNNIETYSQSDDGKDTINSSSQIVFGLFYLYNNMETIILVLPCFIWGAIHYWLPDLFYSFDFYIGNRSDKLF